MVNGAVSAYNQAPMRDIVLYTSPVKSIFYVITIMSTDAYKHVIKLQTYTFSVTVNNETCLVPNGPCIFDLQAKTYNY